MSQFDQSSGKVHPAPEPAPPMGEPKGQGMAATALVMGIIGFLTSCVGIGMIFGILGLVFGLIAMSQMDSRIPGGAKGRGKAQTGAILGGVSVALAVVLPLVIAILLPALGAARRTARQMTNSTQMRGIHQAMVVYAQSNRSQYPGLDQSGNPVDVTVENRFKILLDANFFTPEYIINPQDSSKTKWPGHGTFNVDNYSYSMLDVSEPGGRRDEWRETLNTMAVVLSDRNTGSNSTTQVSSIWTSPNSGDWRGSIAHNDNSTMFETTHRVYQTQYGGANPNNDDNLFDATDTDDAMMIHSGD